MFVIKENKQTTILKQNMQFKKPSCLNSTMLAQDTVTKGNKMKLEDTGKLGLFQWSNMCPKILHKIDSNLFYPSLAKLKRMRATEIVRGLSFLPSSVTALPSAAFLTTAGGIQRNKVLLGVAQGSMSGRVCLLHPDKICYWWRGKMHCRTENKTL